jgi:hypothetical protein
MPSKTCFVMLNTESRTPSRDWCERFRSPLIIFESGVAGYTCVVDKNIDWSHILNNPFDTFLARIEVRDMRYRDPVSGCMHLRTY